MDDAVWPAAPTPMEMEIVSVSGLLCGRKP
jgi:hypothetical protein